MADELDDKIDIYQRITALETNLSILMTNHFPHLSKKVDKLNTKFSTMIILLISNLVALVFTLVKINL